jgi:hypothetical protein
MAADCSNYRLVQLGPPAHRPITSVQTSFRRFPSLPCPATSSVPTWLVPYLRWAHGGCLDDSGRQKMQTCTAWASSPLYHYLGTDLYQAYCITTMPSNIFRAHLASTIPMVVSWWLPRWQRTAVIADLVRLGLQRIAPLPRYRPLPGVSHHYHAQQHLQCPLGFYHTCGGLMVAA